MLVDPAARRSDGESVRIAKDVLSAGATAKVCLPEGPEEFARALARRGARRPVVVGDDRALLRAVSLLHRERELGGAVLSLVPVGSAVGLAHALGVPSGPVAAARAALDGTERRLDLLVDDSDGVVLGELHIPPVGPSSALSGAGGSARPFLRTCRSLVRGLGGRGAARADGEPGAAAGGAAARLRIEADGVTLADLDEPVDAVSLGAGDGLARVEVRFGAGGGARREAVRVGARSVTVSGADFRYRADAVVSGPVRRRTWVVRAGAWSLALP
ncbi:diacylglycerol kinase [Streptomyces sp. SID5785]|nr:diacylglycerol kinase [Streptomyces sp. SID5785]